MPERLDMIIKYYRARKKGGAVHEGFFFAYPDPYARNGEPVRIVPCLATFQSDRNGKPMPVIITDIDTDTLEIIGVVDSEHELLDAKWIRRI